MSPIRIAAGLAALLALVTSATSAGSGRRPSLQLAGDDPVTVVGRDFAPRERTRLTLVAGATRAVRETQADRRGGFRASFPGVFVDRCSASVSVAAVGSRGSRAAVKRPQRQCPPAP